MRMLESGSRLLGTNSKVELSATQQPAELNKNQLGLMESDMCILVNEEGELMGSVSKKDSHVFSAVRPRGELHRAFSVFLFNEDNKLLLQQRAAEKITFPQVWTNTCCSHPLVGMTPDEVDTDADVRAGRVMGVKHAAVRKLQQELGIRSEDIPVKDFKYLTRLHYWAADIVTHGKKAPWGEHEIDYILFIKVTLTLTPALTLTLTLTLTLALILKVKAPLTFKPNEEEVMDTKWVDLAELQTMMEPSRELLWSPWFSIVARHPHLLEKWMADVDATISTDVCEDFSTIHRFDPSREHMGGAGGAGVWLGTL